MCTVTADAPVPSLDLQQDIMRFKTVDSGVAEVTLQVMSHHIYHATDNIGHAITYPWRNDVRGVVIEVMGTYWRIHHFAAF